MAGERWAKKVYRYVGVKGLNTQWEKKVRKIANWKGIDRRGAQVESEEQWVRRERREVEEQGRRDRAQKAERKSSLKYYAGYGGDGWKGIYDGSCGSGLL